MPFGMCTGPSGDDYPRGITMSKEYYLRLIQRSNDQCREMQAEAINWYETEDGQFFKQKKPSHADATATMHTER